jgi:PGF-pre-PGF domain-containing protein
LAYAAWDVCEQWAGVATAPAQWHPVELWAANVSAPPAIGWYATEIWGGNISAPYAPTYTISESGTVDLPGGKAITVVIQKPTLQALSFKSDVTLRNVAITVSEKGYTVAAVPQGHELYKSLDISVSKDVGAEITFRVDEAWYSAKDIVQLYLLRYAGGRWQRLDTTMLRSDGNYRYYSAATPGFSEFAIVGVPMGAPALEEEREERYPPLSQPISPEPAYDIGEIIFVISAGVAAVMAMVVIRSFIKKPKNERNTSKLPPSKPVT